MKKNQTLPPGADASSDLPMDFTRYLGERLNLPEGEVLSLLGQCLVEYKPVRPVQGPR